MIVKNKKSLLQFLINRWSQLLEASAVERLYNIIRTDAMANNTPPPEEPIAVTHRPSQQIDIIKKHISSILSKAEFINYSYDPPVKLKLEDHIELYIADQQICISKVADLIETCVK